MTKTPALRLTGLAVCAVLPSTGCRAPVKMPDPFPVGVAYDTTARGPVIRGAPSSDIDDDLAVLRDLGFNTLFVPADGPTPVSLLRAAADRYGMALRVRSALDTQAPGGDAESPSGGVSPDGLARIDVCQPTGQGDASVGLWLYGYHRALAAGGTNGVVFDRFRSTRADREGLIAADGRLSTKRASAVKGITRRARLWGPRLRGMTVRPVPLDPLECEPVSAVLFSGPKRRYLMLWNTSRHEFSRTRLTIETYRLGAPPRKFVTVPIDERAVVGDIYTVRRDRVSLRTHLGPGDAHLYEIF